VFEHLFEFPLQVRAGPALSLLGGHAIEDAIDVGFDLV
jgi:hypothetical protein